MNAVLYFKGNVHGGHCWLRWVLLFTTLVAQVASANEPVSIQLIWKHQFEFAAFYAAKEMGYYRDAGLDVTIKEGGPGIDAIEKVVEGDADFGVGTSELIVQRYNGKPIVVLASMMQHSPIALLAKRTASVRSVNDLAGKPIAVDPHSKDEIEAYLRASSIPKEGIHFVEQTDWTLGSLNQGKIAAKAVYVSNEPFDIRDKEHEYLLLTPRSAGIDLFGNMLYTTEKTLERRPDVVKAFREATLKGWVYALDNPGPISDLILAQYNTQQKSRAHLLYEAEKIRDLTRPDIVEAGYMNPGRWRHVIEVYASQGVMPADFSLDGFLYDTSPPKVPRWIVWSIPATLFVFVVMWIITSRTRHLNLKLQREVSERKVVEESLRHSKQSLVEAQEIAQLGSWELDLAKQQLHWSDEVFHIFEIDSDRFEASYEAFLATIHPDDREMVSKAFADSVRDHASYDIEHRLLMPDGRIKHVQERGTTTYDEHGHPLRSVGTVQDITERKQLERMKDEFVSMVSHELRTPLTSIVGSLGLINGGALGAVPDSIKPVVEIATRNSERLTLMINDLLDMEKLVSGKMKFHPERCQLDQLVAQGVEANKGYGDRLGVSFTLNMGLDKCQVEVDPLRFQQILSNILSNAAKFSRQGDVVEVTIESQGSKARVSVRDHGPGIPVSFREHIFQKFRQADSSDTRQHGGTGLGLAISKELAHRMGGTVGFDSVEGEGATFYVELPLCN